MSSRGPMIAGSDGSDFTHRQKVADHYKLSVQNKSRLKYCILFHYLLFFLMVAKLCPDVLDRLDIFVLEIEELEIPKPLFWEYLWCLSLPASFLALRAIKHNCVRNISLYIKWIILLGILPVVYAFFYYLSDVYKFITESPNDSILKWRNFPYGILWYIFIALAVQIHGFSIHFASNLKTAWVARGTAQKRK
ncbi:protein jagunal [Daktulosphaira vitifoliae]|uniref:protein jagunal n=1 Tax=Daktulosphaira vitifoliae TaxID=58002 RepID=UPI0021AA823D|nr:protein jagunal [Daktulosphaira vitifoliae]